MSNIIGAEYFLVIGEGDDAERYMIQDFECEAELNEDKWYKTLTIQGESS